MPCLCSHGCQSAVSVSGQDFSEIFWNCPCNLKGCSALARLLPTPLYWTLAPRRRRFTVRSMCALGWRLSLWLGLYQHFRYLSLIPTVAIDTSTQTSLGRIIWKVLWDSNKFWKVQYRNKLLEQTGQIGGTIPHHWWPLAAFWPGVPRACWGLMWSNDVGSSPILLPTHHSPLGLSCWKILAIVATPGQGLFKLRQLARGWEVECFYGICRMGCVMEDHPFSWFLNELYGYHKVQIWICFFLKEIRNLVILFWSYL